MKYSRASRYGEYSTEEGHTQNPGYPPGVSLGEMSPLFDFSRKPWLLLSDVLRQMIVAHTVVLWTDQRAIWSNKGKGREFTLLDAACGYGELYTLLRDARKVSGSKFNYLGVDLDPDKIAVGRVLRPGADLRVLDVRNIAKLTDVDWDIIVSSETLEHLTKDEGIEFLEQAAQIIAPDGLLILTVPTPQMSIRAKRPFHQYEWPRDELMAEVELAGFQILDEWPLSVHKNDWDIDVIDRLPHDITRPTAGALLDHPKGIEGIVTLIVAKEVNLSAPK